MNFLQGNISVAIGLVAFALALATARFGSDELHRLDARGAVRWLGLFLLLRANALWLEDAFNTEWDAYLKVSWMLALAYGLVRLAVTWVMWVRRRITRSVAAKIHRDVADFILYVAVTIPILRTQLKLDVTTLLGTSAVLSLVLGFALQDTLGNVFAGLSLQLEAPFNVGDWIRVGEKSGRVVQIAWRSTRIQSFRDEVITIPNSQIAKEQVTNFTRGDHPIGFDLAFGASYDAAPNQVKREAFEALSQCPLVLKQPEPSVRLVSFADSQVTYQARFFTKDFGQGEAAIDEVLNRLWYRFGREGIEIPFPQRVVHMKTTAPKTHEPDLELLMRLPLFSPFPKEEAEGLSRAAVERVFGAGEAVIVEGREGTTFYVVVRGKLSVRVGLPAKEIATLERGAAFGEMSLLTGEPRAATVIALEDCVLMELGRDAFAHYLQRHPERLAQLAQLIEERKAGIAAATSASSTEPSPAPGRVLAKLKEIFSLK